MFGYQGVTLGVQLEHLSLDFRKRMNGLNLACSCHAKAVQKPPKDTKAFEADQAKVHAPPRAVFLDAFMQGVRGEMGCKS